MYKMLYLLSLLQTQISLKNLAFFPIESLVPLINGSLMEAFYAT